jgi:hypothetical protein
MGGTVVSKEFEKLCEKEFVLKQDEAYEGFDRELANLREHYSYHGLPVSSSRGQAVMDAALLRFDRILDAFEDAYLTKFSDAGKPADEEDFNWLKTVAAQKMEPAIFELRTKVQSDLWEKTCALVRYWEKVEIEARKRTQKIRDKIEIIHLQKKERAVQNAQESVGYRLLPKSSTLLPRPLTNTAKELFAGPTGLSGPQLFDFFANYSESIARMRYGSDVPSRKEMFDNFLESLPAEDQREALLALCDGYPMKTPPDDGAVHALREKIRGVPVPASLGKAVEKIDVEYVAKHWQKLLQRLASDPEGAITSARSLLESVCLYLLDCMGKKFVHAGDLPSLYRATVQELDLAPKKEDEESIRQILGSCSGIVQGVAALRNQFGDAHGRLGEGTERRLAHLTANSVGTLCTFLIESMESTKIQRP